ncbi:Vacuolar protein sorting-associated protein like [Actinidia chinensis var. chinensis]|uniref:Vacuolar protein sorting-associated protein like n=2 Tax=Actinidia TaxID=3624 RepID=A0A2R6RQN9_ACTCC|nr:Vacuolar protein sorting-associated protein like [Actinidia chinensis var. chinensis]
MGGVGGQVMKRIPSIKFPLRYPKPSASGSSSQIRAAPKEADDEHISMSSSDVPAAPINTAVGGKASLQPKRTPVSDREIDAILLGGCL